MADRKLPLAGIRILAIEHYGAGPFGSVHLADLGADVIKIEERAAGGDMSRGVGPHHFGAHDSTFYQPYNRNKRSICLDLKSEAGRAVFHRLVGHADAVFNNMRGSQPAKLGITYADLAREFGIPETQVTNHLAFARREFRRLLLEKLREITVSDEEIRSDMDSAGATAGSITSALKL